MSSTKSKTKGSSKKEDPQPASAQNKGDKLGVHLAETAWRVAVPFLVFSLGGIWLDEALESEPMFTMIGIALALVSVFVVMYKYVSKHFPDTFGGGKK
mgnify:CR=1 FL=1